MKNSRQQKILELIEKYDLDTQDALLVKLREEGFVVTQTTISRDIKSLSLVKGVAENGTYKYVAPEKKENAPVINSSITDSVISVDTACNIVVVKTFSGMANAIAVCIENLGIKDVVGSVAGDDTLLMIMRTVEEAEAVASQLKEVFGH